MWLQLAMMDGNASSKVAIFVCMLLQCCWINVCLAIEAHWLQASMVMTGAVLFGSERYKVLIPSEVPSSMMFRGLKLMIKRDNSSPYFC